ncbi:MAG: GNAT family N-acetyltransferase [Actinomycetota bacterium]
MAEDDAGAGAAPEVDSAPPPGVEIRPGRPSDAASFLEMWRGVVEERRWVRTETVGGVRAYRRSFGESWSDERARLLAVGPDGVVGIITIERMTHPVNRHVATLGMAVHSSWRGHGVGSALMVEALRWARESGVEKVTLEVYPGNDAAIALYRKFGFVEEGRLARQTKKSYGYEDEVIMSRWLA